MLKENELGSSFQGFGVKEADFLFFAQLRRLCHVFVFNNKIIVNSCKIMQSPFLFLFLRNKENHLDIRIILKELIDTASVCIKENYVNDK